MADYAFGSNPPYGLQLMGIASLHPSYTLA